MGGGAVNVTNFADLSGPICECIDQVTAAITAGNTVLRDIGDEFEEARQDIGDGIGQLATQLGACCTAYVNARYVTPATASVTTTSTDADGNTTSTTQTSTGTGVDGLGYAAYLNGINSQTSAYQNMQNDWQDLWAEYIADYDDWRNQTQGVYFAQILLDMVVLAEMLGLRRDFLSCAKEALTDLKGLQSCLVADSIGQVKSDHEGHKAAMLAKSAEMMPAACAVLDQMGVRSEALFSLWEQSGDGAGLGYAPSQSAHVENMSTHMAELCFLGRDAAQELSAICTELDDVWRGGGGWKLYEDKLTATGAGTFQDSVCNTATKTEDICKYMNDCGQMLASLYHADDGSGSYVDTINPTMTALIEAINEGGDVVTALQENITTAQECVTTIKDRYENVYGAAEDTISPAIMATAGSLFENPELFTECFDFITDCATTYKDGFTAYHETGELPLSEAVFAQATAIATNQNHLLAIDFISKYKDDCLAIYANAYEGGETQLQMSVLQLATDMTACITAAHTWFCEHADEMDACWQAGYAGEKDWANTLLTQATALLDKHAVVIEWLCDCAVEIKSCYNQSYLPGEKQLAGGVLAAANQLVTAFVAEHDYFTGKSLEEFLCWQQDYKPGEKILAGGVFDTANKLIADMCANNDWFDNKAVEEFECWIQDYRPGEKVLAGQIYTESEALVPELSAMYEWFKEKGKAHEACFDGDYLPKEKAAMVEIMDEGTQLADCVSLTHGWLCDQADKTYEHWCEYWLPKEQDYACKILDQACELAEDGYECIENWCALTDTQIEWWRECYEQVECANLPKLIEAISAACVKNAALYNETCDRSNKQYDGWCDYWSQCDIEDMQRACAITDKVEPLVQICDDNACVQSLGEILKSCYQELVLPCEKAYIDEICNLNKYDPRYCDMEDRAIAHVREQYGMTEEKLLKQASKYCGGSTLHALNQLEIERVRTESAAAQAADRWEWWRTMQECDRRHRYKLDIFQVGERYATNSMQAYQLSTQGNDLILGRIHERLMRGFQWLNSSQQNSAQTYQGLSTAMQLGIEATRVGHFWPQWYTDNKDRYLSHVENRLNHADDIMRIGQQHNQQAFQSKQSAGQLALGAMDRTLQSISQGHELAQMASQDKQQAMQVLQAAIQFAQQTVSQGHNINAQASADQQSAEAIVEAAIRQAQQTVTQGHNVSQMATQDQQLAHNVSNDAVSQGQTTVQLGHSQLERAINAKIAAGRATEAVQDDAQQTANLGHFYHSQASADKQAALNAAQGAMDDGQSAVQAGLNHKARALEAANLEGSHANQSAQLGLAATDRGHNLGRMALDAKQAAVNEALGVWGQFNNQLDHARGLLQTANQWAQTADVNLRDLHSKGMDAAGFQLANFNAATQKIGRAQDAARDSVDDMLNLYTQSLQRQNTMLNTKQTEADWVRTSVGTFTGFMDQGNRHFLGGSNNLLGNEAALRKQCMEYLCSEISRDTDRYWQKSCDTSSAIFGLSYQAANDATNNSLNNLSSILGGLNGIVGPPPAFNPVGFNSGGSTITTVGPGPGNGLSNLNTGTNNTPF